MSKLKKHFVSVILLVFIMILGFLYLINSSRMRSEEEIFKEAKILVINKFGSEFEIRKDKSFVDRTIINVILGRNRWYIYLDESYEVILHINAYSGQLIEIEDNYMVSFYIMQQDIYIMRLIINTIIILNIILVIYMDIGYSSKRKLKLILIAHLILCVIFSDFFGFVYSMISGVIFEVLRWIYNIILNK